MPRARKRNRGRDARESSVIETEPDNRRAMRDNDDDDAIGIVEAVSDGFTYPGDIHFTNNELSNYRRFKIRKSRAEAFRSEKDSSEKNSSGDNASQNNASQNNVSEISASEQKKPTTFFDLPIEVKNMIYRYLVLSKHRYCVRIGKEKNFRFGGIETAILRTNKQIYFEAANILYRDNVFEVKLGFFHSGVPFRMDDDTTSMLTTRSLRSGREVSMAEHKGLIYQHVFFRIRKLRIVVELTDTGIFLDALMFDQALNIAENLNDLIESLSFACRRNEEIGSDLVFPRSNEWEMIIKSPRTSSLAHLDIALAQVNSDDVRNILQHGMLRIRLEGNFPRGWESRFEMLENEDNFLTEDVQEHARPPSAAISQWILRNGRLQLYLP